MTTSLKPGRGDITTTRLERRFDAVLALFHVVSYQTTNPAVQALFANAAHHLKLGGLFFFNVWYSPAVTANCPELRVKRLQRADLAIIRIPNSFSPPTPTAWVCTTP